jgi:hypothetical protein
MTVSEISGDYVWGKECDSGLFVGLHLDGQEFGLSSPVRWRFALRNDGSEARTLTIDYDLDRTDRYRLQVFRKDTTGAASEFRPPLRMPVTSSNIARNITLGKGELFESKIHEAMIGARLGPGTYHLNIIYGGPGFTFECTSGVLEIQIK